MVELKHYGHMLKASTLQALNGNYDIEKLKASTAGDGTYEGYSAPEKAQLQVMKEKAMASAIRRSKLFKLLDADNNKQVTSEEWARHHEL